jgi:hypothetical protein
MDSRNLLVFTVYIIIVIYVFYKAYQSLETQITLELDNAFVNDELTTNGIKNIVDIDFKKLKPSYQLDDLKTLRIGIKNKSSEDSAITIRVNWDESSITNYEGNVSRIIRVTKGLGEIPQKQVPSIIVANQKIDEELSDDKDINGNLFKVEKLKKASKKSEPFTLRLSFKISQPGAAERSCFVNCKLIPKKLRWTKALVIALTPLPKKKS